MCFTLARCRLVGHRRTIATRALVKCVSLDAHAWCARRKRVQLNLIHGRSLTIPCTRRCLVGDTLVAYRTHSAVVTVHLVKPTELFPLSYRRKWPATVADGNKNCSNESRGSSFRIRSGANFIAASLRSAHGSSSLRHVSTWTTRMAPRNASLSRLRLSLRTVATIWYRLRALQQR